MKAFLKKALSAPFITITFNDVFKKCHIENADNKTKKRARQLVVDFMTHLKEKSVIRNLEVTKKGNTFYSVKFSYASKALKSHSYVKVRQNSK